VAGHVPWEHDGCWFDSSLLDCDVRELANPVHCECISDGIVTRTSPPALARGTGALPPKQQRRAFDSRRELRRSRIVRPASSERMRAEQVAP
jgi:hypothetical protein